MSAIFCAIEEGNEEGLQKLLSMAQIDVNQSSRAGDCAVLLAAGFGRVSILHLLASRNANLAQVDWRGDSAVVWAARHGQIDAIEYLVAQGVHINTQNKASSHCLGSKSVYGEFVFFPRPEKVVFTPRVNMARPRWSGSSPPFTSAWTYRTK